jgi:uncharacterized protein (UPF0297 family)
MMDDEKTMMFKVENEKNEKIREVIDTVYSALKDKGYNPIYHIVGYILSGDPTYITNHQNARNKIKQLDRDEMLEEIVKYYLEKDS